MVFANNRRNILSVTVLLSAGLLTLIQSACVTTATHVSPEEKQKAKQAEAVISRIHEINTALPMTIRCKVSVSGFMEGRPFAADGEAKLSRDPQRARIQLKDPIFLAPALEIYADTETIKFYFPVERIAQVARGNYTDLSLQTRGQTRYLIAWMFSGTIPLIENYTVSSLTHEETKTTLIISNETVEQTIVMRGDTPYEVTLVNKTNKLHYRVRYGQLYRNNERLFFRSINAWSRTTGDRVKVRYSSLQFDRQIPNREFVLEIPADVSVRR